MKKHFAWTCFVFAGICNEAKAQKQTSHVQQFWMAYANQTRMSDRWGTWLDLHIRTREDFFTDLSTTIIRPGITYYATDRLRLTVGYAYVTAYPGDNHSGVRRPEHRPWQQILWQTQNKRSRMVNYIRFEQRYRRKIKNPNELGGGYNFNFKLRYSTLLNLPLAAKPFAPKTFSGTLNNEIHVNFGREIVYNYFDQNRFFAGVSYHLDETSNLQFGYMNLFQQLAAGNQYKMIHTARINFNHNIDLRKK